MRRACVSCMPKKGHKKTAVDFPNGGASLLPTKFDKAVFFRYAKAASGFTNAGGSLALYNFCGCNFTCITSLSAVYGFFYLALQLFRVNLCYCVLDCGGFVLYLEEIKRFVGFDLWARLS